MCGICTKARKLPVKDALAFLAREMAKADPKGMSGPRPCVDKTIGELAGIDEPELNADADAEWQARR